MIKYNSTINNPSQWANSQEECIFGNMAQYFEWRINKKRTPSDFLLGDFTH